MAAAVFFEPLLLLDEARASALHLGLQELVGALGLSLPVLEVFLDHQRGNSFRDPLHRFGVTANVADGERRCAPSSPRRAGTLSVMCFSRMRVITSSMMPDARSSL